MGISIWQLLIVLVIVLLLFGTKKLKNIGSDLGGAVRGFKTAMKDGKEGAEEEPAEDPAQLEKPPAEQVVEAEGVETKRDSA